MEIAPLVIRNSFPERTQAQRTSCYSFSCAETVDTEIDSGIIHTAVDETALVNEKRWAGRVAECSGLENRRRFIAVPGFESLAHRHFLLNTGA